jgi:sugar phosphate isomerase/epimerase
MATNNEPPTTNIHLGLSSYTFGWAVGVPGFEPARPLDEQGLLDKVREHGLRLLQVGDNLPLHALEETRLAAFAERAVSDGVEIEVGTRRLTVERVDAYVRLARRLGSKLIRIVIDDTDYHPTPSDVAAVLRECAGLLDGVSLGIENHDRFPARVLRDMIERAGCERIGVCLDTANSLGAGEGIEVVAQTLAPLVLNLHIKDFHIARVPYQMGFTVAGRPAGNGFLDLPRLLQQLEGSPCRTAVLELWTPHGARVEETVATEAAWAAQSIQYLKPFFKI